MPLIEQFQIIGRIMHENRQKNQMQFGSAIFLVFSVIFLVLNCASSELWCSLQKIRGLQGTIIQVRVVLQFKVDELGLESMIWSTPLTYTSFHKSEWDLSSQGDFKSLSAKRL